MRAVAQRVSQAAVSVEGEVVGEIGRGLLVYLGVGRGDVAADLEHVLKKVLGLRVFPNDAGKLDHSVVDVGASLLVVSQFTLYADTVKGRRPSFIHAAAPEQAEPLVEAVADALRALGATVVTGKFRAFMEVELVNDGPFTLLLETGA
ncbi:MAG TPA: D-aminoacyl-tRNA deacylase [Acidimicrobiales bacterium]|nr:D-aminoacyl-tRNA deacylase [Acidimicrobiales bacterium]